MCVARPPPKAGLRGCIAAGYAGDAEAFPRVSFSCGSTPMLRWFQALMPKEAKFFGLFSQHAEVIVAGARALRAMLDGGEAVERQFANVMAREHDADLITRDILIA